MTGEPITDEEYLAELARIEAGLRRLGERMGVPWDPDGYDPDGDEDEEAA
jgi:hypothetical protein